MIFRRNDHWWIGDPEGDIGPYETRREAEADRAGMRRSERHIDTPGYWTTDKAS